jgi:hypothetical protein
VCGSSSQPIASTKKKGLLGGDNGSIIKQTNPLSLTLPLLAVVTAERREAGGGALM